MLVPSCLEIFCYSNIEVWIRTGCGGFVDHVAAVTLAVERARFSFRRLAVAFPLSPTRHQRNYISVANKGREIAAKPHSGPSRREEREIPVKQTVTVARVTSELY